MADPTCTCSDEWRRDRGSFYHRSTCQLGPKYPGAFAAASSGRSYDSYDYRSYDYGKPPKLERTIEAIARDVAGPRTSFTYRGQMRLHFNRHGAAPLVCSVATDDWELNVSGFEISAPARSVYRPKATPDDEDGRPSFWIEVDGTLTLIGSVARITEAP